MQTIGSRAEVWHGNAHHTSGGLTKKNLLKNKWGRIVSAKKHRTAKKDTFGVVKRGGMKGGEMGETSDQNDEGEEVTEVVGGACKKSARRKGGNGSRKRK